MSDFEKLAAARTLEFFQRYTRDANPARALEILSKAGAGNPPMPGDELPESWKGWQAEDLNDSPQTATRNK